MTVESDSGAQCTELKSTRKNGRGGSSQLCRRLREQERHLGARGRPAPSEFRQTGVQIVLHIGTSEGDERSMAFFFLVKYWTWSQLQEGPRIEMEHVDSIDFNTPINLK